MPFSGGPTSLLPSGAELVTAGTRAGEERLTFLDIAWLLDLRSERGDDLALRLTGRAERIEERAACRATCRFGCERNRATLPGPRPAGVTLPSFIAARSASVASGRRRI